MTRLMQKLFVALGFVGLIGAAGAQAQTQAQAMRASEQEAVNFVKRAVDFYKQNGQEKAFTEFNNQKGNFIDRDLYIYVYSLDGRALAHGANANLIGKNQIGLRDVDGKPVVQQFIDVVATKGAGWVDYKWANPVTKQVEFKRGYVERVGDVLIGSGVYKQ